MSRNHLLLLMIAILGLLLAGVGIGYGLGQYTVSGLNPFFADPGEVAAARDGYSAG